MPFPSVSRPPTHRGLVSLCLVRDHHTSCRCRLVCEGSYPGLATSPIRWVCVPVIVLFCPSCDLYLEYLPDARRIGSVYTYQQAMTHGREPGPGRGGIA